MSLYRDISDRISTGDTTKEYYRFQGAKTASRMDIGADYIYFSKSIDHHMYFTIKRLKQLLSKLLLEEDIIFNQRSLRNPDECRRINNLVLNSEQIENLFSYRLVCSKNIDGLLKQNCIFSDRKPDKKKYIERVDRRVYGGGYGVADEWRELMIYLTYFTARQKINREDLLEIIRQMKISGSMNRKDNIAHIIRKPENYTYRINDGLLSDFNKYNIIDVLERILEKGLANPESELSTAPDKTIRRIVDDYERDREKTLILLGKRGSGRKVE